MKQAQSLFIYSQTRAVTLSREKQTSLIIVALMTLKEALLEMVVSTLRTAVETCFQQPHPDEQNNDTHFDFCTIRIINAASGPNRRKAASRNRMSMGCERHVLLVGSIELKNPKTSCWNVSNVSNWKCNRSTRLSINLLAPIQMPTILRNLNATFQLECNKMGQVSRWLSSCLSLLFSDRANCSVIGISVHTTQKNLLKLL